MWVMGLGNGSGCQVADLESRIVDSGERQDQPQANLAKLDSISGGTLYWGIKWSSSSLTL